MICHSYVFRLIVKLSKLCNKTNRLECPVLCSVTLDQTTHLSLYSTENCNKVTHLLSGADFVIECYYIM